MSLPAPTPPICAESARSLLEAIREARYGVNRLKDMAENIGAGEACQPLMDAYLSLNDAVVALHKPAGLRVTP
jgi:hypothetical protein